MKPAPDSGGAAVEAAPDAALEVRDVVKTFGSVTAVDHLTFTARRGEVLPQKTTYFFPKLISGLLFHPL